MDGLVCRPREAVGEAGDLGLLLDEVFRGGVDGRAGGLGGFEDLGDGSLSGLFSCHSSLARRYQGPEVGGIYLDNGRLVWRIQVQNIASEQSGQGFNAVRPKHSWFVGDFDCIIKVRVLGTGGLLEGCHRARRESSTWD